MARGWESKSVRAEIDAAAERSATERSHEVSSETLDLPRKRESILMCRSRVVRDIENAQNPRYKAILCKALADLDVQLAALALPAAAREVAVKTTSVIPSARTKPTSPPSKNIARILAIASAAFDDEDKAGRWLREPNIQTGNIPPVSLIGTPEGFAVVESVLHQIQYGVFG